jgi:hypothetical protein
MRFHADTFNLNSLSRSLLAGAMLSVVISCADSFAPASAPELEPNFATDEVVPESVKEAFLALESAPSVGMSSSNLSASYSVTAGPMASLSASAGSRPYTVSRVDFAPEPSPSNVVPLLKDDGFYGAFIPIGFDFEFYGEVHDKFNVHSNGFIMFGPLPGTSQSFWVVDNIPAPALPNNMIALAWADWDPRKAGSSIRYETRGEPGSRRLVLQYENVGEAGTNVSGKLTSQLVIEEGTNRITIYTTSMTIRAGAHRVTQGVENALGTTATFDSITNAISGVTSARVRGFFDLTSDAVSFLPPPPNKAPVTLVPGNMSVSTAPGSCSAAVEVGSAGVTDDAPGASVVGGARSDGLPLDALYPKGVTTITWTSIDVEEKTSTANQLITVSDTEKPSVTAPAGLEANNDPLRGSAVLVAGNASGEDNCGETSIVPSRSDNAALSAPFPVGLTTITWTATDGSGNTASATQIVLVRDIEAPRISASDIELDATSRSGAVVPSYNLVFGDNVRVVQVSCTPEPGSMFRPGSTPVTCTVADAAGYSASATFNVIVHGAAEQIVALASYMETLGLSGGAGNPMLNQLRAALGDIENENGVSCKKLDDFLRMLTDRKKSSELSYAEMFEILDDAKRIKAVLGCQ